jgi:hypothetical protein
VQGTLEGGDIIYQLNLRTVIFRTDTDFAIYCNELYEESDEETAGSLGTITDSAEVYQKAAWTQQSDP